MSPPQPQGIAELESFRSESMACHLAKVGVSVACPALPQGVTLVRPSAKGFVPRTPRR